MPSRCSVYQQFLSFYCPVLVRGKDASQFSHLSFGSTFGEKRLKELLNKLLDLDVATKTGELDAEEAATLVILQYAKPQN